MFVEKLRIVGIFSYYVTKGRAYFRLGSVNRAINHAENGTNRSLVSPMIENMSTDLNQLTGFLVWSYVSGNKVIRSG